MIDSLPHLVNIPPFMFRGIDYKNLSLLRKYVSENKKILSSKISSVSLNKQRKLTREIKKAKILGLI